MKKEVEVTHKAKVIRVPKKKEIRTEVYCDICGKIVDVSRDYHYCSGGHNCTLCGRDFCRTENTAGKPTCYCLENDWDDCPDKYCIHCYELRFSVYPGLYQKESDRHSKQLEELDKMLKKLSLAVTK